MTIIAVFLVGAVLGLALRPLVDAYVRNSAAHRFELDASTSEDADGYRLE